MGNYKEIKEKSWFIKEIKAKKKKTVKSSTFSILISKVPGALITQNTVSSMVILIDRRINDQRSTMSRDRSDERT